ncbi:type II toxin-antitoxin system RelE/ParE family toxin [Prosthecodimorpha staleyi]|uniref:Type II toxin-antitoxin system RelE/ParE family toxin n=1 Tax=Prosthecodimorpha staleyi TaxID=2840188 RepID=A0A947D8T3_9HYPH|nr:type II toxin-antitoxin system RelE/ParE family toxin [Prosthecodimorpha staleyi]MBT9293116.1 type II toxin-antitoxin system RelE/ParE family toxin [Prosthecodimorpha staleyi]
MRRLKVSYRPESEADLLQIYRWVLDLSRSRAIARGFVRRIRDRCERIGNVPLGGRPRDDLEPGLRTVPFEKSAVIAYKVEADRVRITNVFYGGRDYEALYRGAPVEDER